MTRRRMKNRRSLRHCPITSVYLIQHIAARDISLDSHLSIQGKRGQHVKNKPWMSAKGREGQRVWEDNLARVRQEWMNSGIPRHPDLHIREMLLEQIECCKQRKMKKQKETLLLVLQMCAHRQVIHAFPFVHPSSRVYNTCAPVSFLGWTGFQVIPHRAEAFADELIKLFPNLSAGGSSRQDLFSSRSAMVEAFRRAGLQPETQGRWEDAFRGVLHFTFVAAPKQLPGTEARLRNTVGLLRPPIVLFDFCWGVEFFRRYLRESKQQAPQKRLTETYLYGWVAHCRE